MLDFGEVILALLKILLIFILVGFLLFSFLSGVIYLLFSKFRGSGKNPLRSVKFYIVVLLFGLLGGFLGYQYFVYVGEQSAERESQQMGELQDKAEVDYDIIDASFISDDQIEITFSIPIPDTYSLSVRANGLSNESKLYSVPLKGDSVFAVEHFKPVYMEDTQNSVIVTALPEYDQEEYPYVDIFLKITPDYFEDYVEDGKEVLYREAGIQYKSPYLGGVCTGPQPCVESQLLHISVD
jgi:hypothetical protein